MCLVAEFKGWTLMVNKQRMKGVLQFCTQGVSLEVYSPWPVPLVFSMANLLKCFPTAVIVSAHLDNKTNVKHSKTKWCLNGVFKTGDSRGTYYITALVFLTLHHTTLVSQTVTGFTGVSIIQWLPDKLHSACELVWHVVVNDDKDFWAE